MEELIPKIPRQLKGNFFRVDNAIFEYTRETFNPASVAAVYFYLARKVDNNTQVCYPSQDTIAKSIGLSRSTVNRCVQTLLKRRIIAISALEGRHNVYLLLDPCEWSKQDENVAKRHRPRKSVLHEYVAAGHTINTPNQYLYDKTSDKIRELKKKAKRISNASPYPY